MFPDNKRTVTILK